MWLTALRDKGIIYCPTPGEIYISTSNRTRV